MDKSMNKKEDELLEVEDKLLEEISVQKIAIDCSVFQGKFEPSSNLRQANASGSQ